MFDPIFDYFRGRAITIPPLDGAFRANGALDGADLCATLPAPDNLALWRGQVLAGSGAEIMTMSGASPANGSVDLMQENASGSVWRHGAPSEPFCQMAGGLAYPYGLLPQANGVIVSESWRHQLLAISGPGKPAAVLRELPGYPCRLQPAPGGGAWLALFAPRNISTACKFAGSIKFKKVLMPPRCADVE